MDIKFKIISDLTARTHCYYGQEPDGPIDFVVILEPVWHNARPVGHNMHIQSSCGDMGKVLKYSRAWMEVSKENKYIGWVNANTQGDPKLSPTEALCRRLGWIPVEVPATEAVPSPWIDYIFNTKEQQ